MVIHGGSGVPLEQRQRLARTSKVCKFNIGTELRLGFGKSIRQILADDGEVFDRIQILKQVEPDLQAAAQFALRGIAAAKN